jgi:hypothetical protein
VDLSEAGDNDSGMDGVMLVTAALSTHLIACWSKRREKGLVDVQGNLGNFHYPESLEWVMMSLWAGAFQAS